jgi:hypothetical protein
MPPRYRRGLLDTTEKARTSFFLSSSREVTLLNNEVANGASDIRIASLVLLAQRSRFS